MGVCNSCNIKAAQDNNVKNLSIVVDQASNSVNSVSLGNDPTKKNSTSIDINNQISKYMKNDDKKDKKIIKLLLLGSGSSGKSTIFRQIESIHGEHKENGDINNTKRIVRLNCVNGLIQLLKQSALLSKAPYNKTECFIDAEDEEIANAVTILVDFKSSFEYKAADITTVDIAVAGESMQFLWALDGVKQTFKNRHYFSFTENVDYFLDKIRAVMDETECNRYVPSFEDMLLARFQTTGIVEKAYFIENAQFNMFDVGGQRNERKKWIQLFDNVNAVIFVAALNHYCSVLFEAENVNAMQESLELFEETVNLKWFTNSTKWILFLNKNDLFTTRLKEDKIALQICFGDEFVGRSYSGNDEEEFGACYGDAVSFIKAKYLSKIRDVETAATIAVHVTVATNKANIQNVFDDVRGGIIRHNLKSCGIITQSANFL